MDRQTDRHDNSLYRASIVCAVKIYNYIYSILHVQAGGETSSYLLKTEITGTGERSKCDVEV